MSLANEASLLLIPSGYKSGKVYSVFPTDGDGDFTFSRYGNASRVNPGGYIETVGSLIPRIDHTGGGCPSLLLEPQRTNNLRYSEDLTNAVWSLLGAGTGVNPVVTANYSSSPSGEQTADRVVFNRGSGVGGNDYSIIRQIVSNVGQGVSSVYMKSNTSQNYSISIDEAGFNNNVTVTPEWQRFEYSESTNDRLQLSLRGGNNSSYADVSIWGAQMEAGSYKSSYIKTTSFSVTRQLDKCINGGNADLFNITEGTLFVDVIPFKASTLNRITLSNNTSNEEIIFYFHSNNTQVQIISESGGSIQVSYIENITFDIQNKLAFTFKKNEFKFYVNGNLVHTDTSGNIATGLNSLHFAGNNGGFGYFQGKVYDTRVYNKVLTEAESIKLTTL